MTRVVVVGCGVVGATLAYELSQHRAVQVTLLDRHLPGEGATGAALGILMAVISHKVKGRNWRLREASLRRYDTLLTELETLLGQPVPHNPQGLLRLCFGADERPRWESLQVIRQRQGWPLEIWSPEQVQAACPHVDGRHVVAGIYSPRDRQIAPKALTQALVQAAQQRGVESHFHETVTGFQTTGDRATAVETTIATYPVDWVVITAGLGSDCLSQLLGHRVPLGPVLGQGVRVQLPRPLGQPHFQPVVTGNDTHLVPLGDREYGIAATVEFPPAGVDCPVPDPHQLETLWQGARAYCPALAEATVLETWHGLRPRPQGQAAPVIEPLPQYRNVWLATGHYRNGVLLAPATAQQVCDAILAA